MAQMARSRVLSLVIHYNLPHMTLSLAPMEDVTDTVFRQIVASIAAPDLFFTEFANVEAILHGEVQRLQFTKNERPIIAQIWGSDPEKFSQAAKIVADMGFEGIDINLGCPVSKITKIDACSALIGQNTKVADIIAAVKTAGLPVSVKTRLGKKSISLDWIDFLLKQNLDTLTVHLRTVSEMSQVPAHWELASSIVELKNEISPQTKIFGNGDVKTKTQAWEYATKYGVDGVMIGRGIFENVGVFGDIVLTQNEKMKLFLWHVELFEKTWGQTKNFAVLKKFMKTYINGFAGASEMRQGIANTRDYAGLKSKLKELIQ